jgi:hypothetical protein
MVMKMAKKKDNLRSTAAGFRKVTYSLPAEVAQEVDRRTAGQVRAKSHVVAEALAFYFASQDREALATLYAQAAEDPQFQADNRAVLRDFESLDAEAGEEPEP